MRCPLGVSAVPFALLLASSLPAGAQWSPDYRVTDDPAPSVTQTDGGRNVALLADSLAVVWADLREGNYEIWFRERIGDTWGTPLPLTADPAPSLHPAVGRMPGETRVVWQDERTGHPEVWTKRRVGGVWSADSCLTCDDFESARPAMDHTGQHVAWEETKDGNREIYHLRRHADGSFDAAFRVSNDAGESSHPSVASDHEVAFGAFPDLRIVAWQDDRDGNLEIYSRISWVDGTWEPETRVSHDPGASRHPSVAAEEGVCGDIGFIANWVAWQDDRHGNDEIFLAEGDYGFWSVGDRLTNTAVDSGWPSVSLAHQALFTPFGLSFCQRPALVWEEAGAGAESSIRFLDLGSGGPAVPVSDTGAQASRPSVASRYEFPGPGLMTQTWEVVWTDLRHGNQEIFHAEGVVEIDATGAPEVAPGSGPLRVSPARPNPFRRGTELSVRLERDSELSVRVIDAAGRAVAGVFRGRVHAGTRVFSWDGRTGAGAPAAAGVYFLRLEGGGEVVTRRVVLLR